MNLVNNFFLLISNFGHEIAQTSESFPILERIVRMQLSRQKGTSFKSKAKIQITDIAYKTGGIQRLSKNIT